MQKRPYNKLSKQQWKGVIIIEASKKIKIELLELTISLLVVIPFISFLVLSINSIIPIIDEEILMLAWFLIIVVTYYAIPILFMEGADLFVDPMQIVGILGMMFVVMLIEGVIYTIMYYTINKKYTIISTVNNKNASMFKIYIRNTLKSLSRMLYCIGLIPILIGKNKTWYDILLKTDMILKDKNGSNYRNH